MFQFRRFPRYTYVFSIPSQEMNPAGLPHSETHGSKPICGSPWLFAAYRVLHRLPVPRHSLYALLRLTLCSLRFRDLCLRLHCVVAFATEITKAFTLLLIVSFRITFLDYFTSSFRFIRFSRFPWLPSSESLWWAQVDSNHRPCAYQAHALTN